MPKKFDYLIVGCGFSGIALAERLASIGKKVIIIDQRNHIGGNCYDYKSGKFIIQKYGPHIFHTKNKTVFNYLKKFTDFNGYKHKVLAYYDKKYFPIPINLDTVNKFFSVNLKDEEELKQFLEDKKKNIKKILNSEDVVVSKFGEGLYNAFVKNYTKKQWDRFPYELDKSVLERLPIRYNKNNFFFDDTFQGMPTEGFTKMFEKMLSSKNIFVKLNTPYKEDLKKLAKKIVWTGKIDRYFNYELGRLEYRCAKFIFEKYKLKNFLPNSVVNFTENAFKFLRITEFKRFYKKQPKKTIICREFYSWEGEPCYPVINKRNRDLLKEYESMAEKEEDVYFLGRLGKFRYLNMDACVEEAFDLFEELKSEKN